MSRMTRPRPTRAAEPVRRRATTCRERVPRCATYRRGTALSNAWASDIGSITVPTNSRVARSSELRSRVLSRTTRRSDIADRVLWLEDGTFREFDAMAYDPVCGMAMETTPG